MVLKKKSKCLKVVINCHVSFDVNSYWLFTKLASIPELKVYLDEFPSEDENHKTVVLNCFSNTLDFDKLLENLTVMSLLSVDYDKGVYHDKDCEFSIYHEVRTSYFNDSVLDIV